MSSTRPTVIAAMLAVACCKGGPTGAQPDAMEQGLVTIQHWPDLEPLLEGCVQKGTSFDILLVLQADYGGATILGACWAADFNQTCIRAALDRCWFDPALFGEHKLMVRRRFTAADGRTLTGPVQVFERTPAFEHSPRFDALFEGSCDIR